MTAARAAVQTNAGYPVMLSVHSLTLFTLLAKIVFYQCDMTVLLFVWENLNHSLVVSGQFSAEYTWGSFTDMQVFIYIFMSLVSKPNYLEVYKLQDSLYLIAFYHLGLWFALIPTDVFVLCLSICTSYISRIKVSPLQNVTSGLIILYPYIPDTTYSLKSKLFRTNWYCPIRLKLAVWDLFSNLVIHYCPLL